MKALLITLGPEKYAIDLALVHEVIYRPTILGIPHPDRALVGMTVWNEQEIPVFDLGLALGATRPLCGGHLVLLQMEGQPVGWMVSEAGHILDLPRSGSITVDENLTGGSEFIKYGYWLNGEMVYQLEMGTMSLAQSA